MTLEGTGCIKFPIAKIGPTNTLTTKHVPLLPLPSSWNRQDRRVNDYTMTPKEHRYVKFLSQQVPLPSPRSGVPFRIAKYHYRRPKNHGSQATSSTTVACTTTSTTTELGPLRKRSLRSSLCDVRIRSTTMVRLLHGLGLLPSGISVAGTGKAMI